MKASDYLATSLINLGVKTAYAVTGGAVVHILDSYKNNLGKFSNLFSGASELIEKIKLNNLKWGIVTNKPYVYASKIIEETPDLSSCMTLVCPDHLKKAKPSPEGILLACNQLNLNPKEVIYFGDHQKDLMASRAATAIAGAVFLPKGSRIIDFSFTPICLICSASMNR